MPAEESIKPLVEVAEEPVVPQETHEVETVPSPQSNVSAEDQLASKIREDFERLYGSRMKELQNGFQAIQRVNTKLQQELEQVKRQAVSPPAASPDGKDPWATIQDGQIWKTEIERVAEEKAAKLFQQQEALKLTQAEAAQQEAIREYWKQQVVTRYPDLAPDGDSTTQVSVLFNEVLNQHPEYLRNPFGPRLAMQDLKDRFVELGLPDPDVTATSPTTRSNQEVIRRSRVAVTSTAPSRTTVPSSTKVTLTKDDMEFCKYHSIDPVTFAKNKQVMESTGSLEVS